MILFVIFQIIFDNLNLNTLIIYNIMNITNIANDTIKNFTFFINNIRKSDKNGMDEYTIVILLCFSSIILIYMTRFIKPEPDDDNNDNNDNNNDNKNNYKKKIKINPYLPFIQTRSLFSPSLPFSPIYMHHFNNFNNGNGIAYFSLSSYSSHIQI